MLKKWSANYTKLQNRIKRIKMAGHYVLKFENENKLSQLFCDIDSNLVIMYSDWAMD